MQSYRGAIARDEHPKLLQHFQNSSISTSVETGLEKATTKEPTKRTECTGGRREAEREEATKGERSTATKTEP